MELLAPAGDIERLKMALLYGADAVYIGGKDYSLRANAKNFSIEEIKESCEFAHKLNKKVYVTVNIVFHDKDLVGLEDYLKSLKECDVDAVIVSDIIGITLANKYKLNVFLSTQASAMNYEAINFWKKLNVSRFVLARECSREDIIRIKKECNCEVECFIHGAMCTSISGKCVLSNYCTNRDSNRGGCAQICRWTFKCDGEDFSFMSKDLSMAYYLEDMYNIGVDSLKIEGRMRSVYYIATVCMCYRRLIDHIINHTLNENIRKYYVDILDRVANRDTVPQFYNKFPTKDESYFADRDEVSNQDFLGLVIDYDKKNKIAYIEERNYFKLGDVVEFIGPDMEEYTYTISSIIDIDDNNVDVARHPKDIYKIPVDKELPKYSMMRLKIYEKNI
jgi:putative protease